MDTMGTPSPTTVYPKKYAHGFCFAALCCGYTLTDFPISIRLTSLALWQSNDCPSASKATLMNMCKYFMWIHYERLHNHNKAKHNKTVCIFLGIYCTCINHHHQCPWIHITYNAFLRNSLCHMYAILCAYGTNKYFSEVKYTRHRISWYSYMTELFTLHEIQTGY